MATANSQPQENTVHNDASVDTTNASNNPRTEKDHKKDVAHRVVWYIAGVLLTLLALRFIFALLGANTGNAIVNFIYSVTYPFVAPFFGIFSYDFTEGASRFETFTLVAMAIYALIAYGIAKLFTLTRR